METNHDAVLIAGAGPTGLALALWLARFGEKVRIVGKNAGPAGYSRAFIGTMTRNRRPSLSANPAARSSTRCTPPTHGPARIR
jgi:thioredoxin reductase